MTFDEVANEYYRQRVKEISVNYGQIEKMIMEAAKTEFPQFSDEQLGFIYGEVYAKYHSAFDECILGMRSYCIKFANWEKLKSKPLEVETKRSGKLETIDTLWVDGKFRLTLPLNVARSLRRIVGKVAGYPQEISATDEQFAESMFGAINASFALDASAPE